LPDCAFLSSSTVLSPGTVLSHHSRAGLSCTSCPTRVAPASPPTNSGRSSPVVGCSAVASAGSPRRRVGNPCRQCRQLPDSSRFGSGSQGELFRQQALPSLRLIWDLHTFALATTLRSTRSSSEELHRLTSGLLAAPAPPGKPSTTSIGHHPPSPLNPHYFYFIFLASFFGCSSFSTNEGCFLASIPESAASRTDVFGRAVPPAMTL
jgi:hypothetical protein